MFVEPPDEREVVAQAVVPNPLVVLACSGHPLAGEKAIAFARLADEPFLMREPGSGTRMITLRLFARHGVVPKTRIELSSDEAIREAILAGLGVSILPRYTLGLDPVLTRLACLDVEGFPLESHWHFVYPVGKRLCAGARAFMDFSRAEAKSLFATACAVFEADAGSPHLVAVIFGAHFFAAHPIDDRHEIACARWRSG
jgi:DNA-binding transcriptional LysR family regulator